ncbi:MAG: hypothetical protein ABIF85_02540 [Nanoarchaeota archaeon]|nr:hypothetical protein [Nanoarchaeota archaeon]MBU4299680.1 hypothetical protein [Nanoarchaeota archaeon]MBU4451517.1 hypothetical protein [Nanoarchaeota archaeon]MCG2723967.1 hypothetical protein [archaeon]
MPSILGMNINKISAEKKDSFNATGLEIKTQPQILDVKETKIKGLANEDIIILSVSFKMASTFSPDMGNISIEGVVLYRPDNQETVMKEWKKSKSMPINDGALILNHIFARISVVGLYLADLLALPPIIALPRVEPKKQ